MASHRALPGAETGSIKIQVSLTSPPQTQSAAQQSESGEKRSNMSTMMRLGWQVRLWVARMIPHTPFKRWAYGLALVAALLLSLSTVRSVALAIVLGAVIVRWIDIQRTSKRRSKLPTARAYFFEGGDSDALGR